MSGYVPPHKRGGDDRQGDDRRGGNDRGGNERFSRGGQNDRDGGFESRGFSSRDNNNRGYNNSGGYNDNRNDNRNNDDRNSSRNTQDRRSNNSRKSGGYSGGDIRAREYSSPTMTRAQRELSKQPDAEIELELFGKKSAQVAQGINFDEYEKIPVDISGVDCPAPIEAFDELLQCEVLLDNILRCKFLTPTPIQKYSIPTVLRDRDLMACAQTGSGKTGAFLIPTVERLLIGGGDRERTTGSRSQFYPLALILAPTRELAQQIHIQSKKLMYMTGMRSCCVYGGAYIKEQFDDLAGGVHIIVATPGRLLDMHERRKLNLSHIQFLIMDEADRMLDMGFEPQIREIIGNTDMPASRRTLMFSATFPDEIQELAQTFLTDYIFLAVGRVGSTTTLITQRVMYVQEEDKMKTLFDVLPHCDGSVLVFTATKRQADSVEYYLSQNGFDAITIHGNKSQSEREYALEEFREGRRNVLVATDVAARGLDIPNVLWVIQFDLPSNSDDYVHRIGRTGRRGNVGTAISFVNETNRGICQDLLRLLTENRQEIPSWFTKLVANTSYHKRGPGRRGGRNKKEMGARDFRANAAPASGKKKKPQKKKKSKFDTEGW